MERSADPYGANRLSDRERLNSVTSGIGCFIMYVGFLGARIADSAAHLYGGASEEPERTTRHELLNDSRVFLRAGFTGDRKHLDDLLFGVE